MTGKGLMMPTQATPRLPIATLLVPQVSSSIPLMVVAAVVLLTLSAKVQIPLWPVPMTMQTYAVLVLAMGLGTRLALVSVAGYLALGAAGLPVFAGTPDHGLGIGYMLGPTGGYLVGFVIATVVCGQLAGRGWDRHVGRSLAAMLLGHAIIIGAGVAWLAATLGIEQAIKVGFTPFVLGTLAKVVMGAVSLPCAWTALRRMGLLRRRT
jgi:biotin transport system substrate-specific component